MRRIVCPKFAVARAGRCPEFKSEEVIGPSPICRPVLPPASVNHIPATKASSCLIRAKIACGPARLAGRRLTSTLALDVQRNAAPAEHCPFGSKLCLPRTSWAGNSDCIAEAGIPTHHQDPVFSIEAQGSAGGRLSPICSSSIEIPSGETTNAMRPSRGGRLMVTPASISCWHLS